MSLIPRSGTHARRTLPALTAVLLLVVLDVSPANRAQASAFQAPEGEIQGVPWTGETGITETVADIMARQRLAPKVDVMNVRPTKPEVEFRREQPLQQNPSARAVSRWPMVERKTLGTQPYNPQTVGTSFLGAQLSESGFIPPDSMGEVGPSQILVYINGRIKVFDKAGTLGALNADLDTFFSSVRNQPSCPSPAGCPVSDPHVRYDRLSGRWFLTIINVPPQGPNRVLIAVSSGSTITNSSSFTFYQFQQDVPNPAVSDNSGFADYDTLGVDKFALYIGVNIFDQAGTSFVGTTGFVVNKANLIGGTLTVTAFRQMAGNTCLGAGPYSPQGVNNDDPSATEGYFIGVDLCLFSTLQVRRVSSPGTTPTLSGNLTVATPGATQFPIDQVQPGGPPSLDALDDRLFAAAIHKNKITGANTLWTAHNIEVNASGVGTLGGGRNGSRWYEIGSLTGTPSIVQSGTLWDPAASNPFGYWIPTVAMSGQGHMALGASRASAVGGTGPASGHASVVVAGRLRTDALGQTQAPTLAVDSDSRYDTSDPGDPERWGDYSAVSVDPNDDMTMWTFQEYANATNSYGVQAIKLVAPPPITPASASAVPPNQPSVNVIVNGTSVSGSEFFDPGPDAGGPGYASHITASVSGGVVVNSITFNNPTQVTLNVSTMGVPPGAVDVTITNPDGQSRTGTGILRVLSNNNMRAQYRLYSPITLEHLYTTDYNEYVVLGTRGWNQEGIAYQIFPDASMYLTVTPIPLYRLYHPGIRQHLWTTDLNEKNVLVESGFWTYEGVIGYLLPTPVSGSTPLYRMSLSSPPLHLWTTDQHEYNVLLNRGWTPEGTIGYVLP